MAANVQSRRVMERLGLSYARTVHLDFDVPIPGTEQGEVIYELRRDDWCATKVSEDLVFRTPCQRSTAGDGLGSGAVVHHQSSPDLPKGGPL